MGTIVAQSTEGEPLLATGTPNVTDMTFRQLRQFMRIVPSASSVGGVEGVNHCAVTVGGAGAVNVSAGYAWVRGTALTGADGQHCYGVPVAARTFSGIPSPSAATRRDIVVLRVYDEGDAPGSGLTAESRLQYIANASETLTAEASPPNSMLLATVDVTTAGARTITDRRQTLPLPGGQVVGGFTPITSNAALTAGGTAVTVTILEGGGAVPMQIRAHAPSYSVASDILLFMDGTQVQGVRVVAGSGTHFTHTVAPFNGSRTFTLRAATAGTLTASATTPAYLRATWAPNYYT